MTVRVFSFAALLLWIPLRADDASARARLMGTWQQPAESTNGPSVWVLEAKGDLLHIRHSQGDQILSEIVCKPLGADCEGTASGKKAKVSMYFNGPTLVQFETVGEDVTKRQFTVAEQNDLMQLEVIPIVGNVKPEKLQLKRLQTPTSNR